MVLDISLIREHPEVVLKSQNDRFKDAVLLKNGLAGEIIELKNDLYEMN